MRMGTRTPWLVHKDEEDVLVWYSLVFRSGGEGCTGVASSQPLMALKMDMLLA